MDFDAIIVGGSYAGISAALPLARARKRVAVIDAGLRRNRFAGHAYGFLGQDGMPPGEIAARAREQLLRYPTVQWIDGTAQGACRDGDGFAVDVAGATLGARRLVLATGVVDRLPEVEGLAERWGRSVFHCPYCHGYELGNGRIGALASGPSSLHQALLLPEWGSVTLFLNGAITPDEAQARELAARGIRIETAAVVSVRDRATVVLAGGRCVELDGLFVASRTEPASPLALRLGCAIEEGPLGPFVRTDEMKATNVPGVFACGDVGRAMGNVAMAVGDGALAGTAVHRSLVFPAAR
jgi:thioredoxin reductase